MTPECILLFVSVSFGGAVTRTETPHDCGTCAQMAEATLDSLGKLEALPGRMVGGLNESAPLIVRDGETMRTASRSAVLAATATCHRREDMQRDDETLSDGERQCGAWVKPGADYVVIFRGQQGVYYVRRDGSEDLLHSESNHCRAQGVARFLTTKAKETDR